MKIVSAYKCEVCGAIKEHKESCLQHEEMCKWQKEGHAVWVENGKVFHAEKIPASIFGSHNYPEDGGSCSFNCGCSMYSHSSSGPVDPFGPCPFNPKIKKGE